MNLNEYRRAVRQAKRILAFVRISDKRRNSVRISRAKALALPVLVKEDEKIDAVWIDDEQTILLIG